MGELADELVLCRSALTVNQDPTNKRIRLVPAISAGSIASPLFTRSGPDGRTVADLPFLVKRQVSAVIV
jgi:hypothetical protein